MPKRLKYLFLSTVFIFLACYTLTSQTHRVGGIVGYGFNNYPSNYPGAFQVGFMYQFKQGNQPFFLRTGISLEYCGPVGDGVEKMFIRFPFFGVDFYIGKKIPFIIGTALQASYLHSSQEDDLTVNNPHFGIGWQANTGVGIKLTDRLRLNILLQYFADFNKTGVSQRSSPGGAPYLSEERILGLYLNAAIIYQLPPKENREK